jgi:hexosaminidase
LQQFGRKTSYGVRFDGYVKVESDGYYQFAVESDDGTVLEIDDEVVVDNDGNHPSRRITGYIPLRQGFHKMRLRYFQAEGGASLDVSWGAADAELQALDGFSLYH